MSSYIDTKFLNLISNRLTNFKQKKPGLWNFRCPHCGDSQKSKSKSRGFVYEKKNNLFFKCHNCGMGQSLGNFVKFLDGNLHKQYVLERYKDDKAKMNQEMFAMYKEKKINPASGCLPTVSYTHLTLPTKA